MALLTPDAPITPTLANVRMDIAHFANITDGDTYVTPLSSPIRAVVVLPEWPQVAVNTTFSGKTVTFGMSNDSAATVLIFAY